MKKVWSWVACITLGPCVACSSSGATSNKGAPNSTVCRTDSNLTYENFGKSFMTSYCTRCHSSALSGSARQGAPTDHNFDTLEQIHATELDHIEEAAAGGANGSAAMPPSDPRPSLAERQQLSDWLACGAP